MARPRLEDEGVGGGGGLFDFLLVLPSWNLLSHLADAFSSSGRVGLKNEKPNTTKHHL